jgi:hypothetical protein
MDLKPQLDYDLYNSEVIKLKCQNNSYAQNLYAAMCNNRFFKYDQEWTTSWRMSGEIVAKIRNCKECYLDWYCSGMIDNPNFLEEGSVSDEIRNDLLNLNWSIKPYEPRLKPGIYQNTW